MGVTLLTTSTAQGKTWAVVIGVSEYADREMSLVFAAKDAEDVARVLTESGSVSSDYILRLTDTAGPENLPTHVNIVGMVPGFLKRATQDDTVIVFLSGHGVVVDGNIYFAPRDYEGSDGSGKVRNAVRFQWLRDEIVACAAGTKLLLIDACRSGQLWDRSVDPQSVFRRYGKTENSGVLTISSCDLNQLSIESAQFRNGLFTHFLLRALRGEGDGNNDRLVTISELFDYLVPTVSAKARERNHKQTPTFSSFASRGFPVVLDLGAQKGLTPIPFGTWVRTLGRGKIEVTMKGHDLRYAYIDGGRRAGVEAEFSRTKNGVYYGVITRGDPVYERLVGTTFSFRIAGGAETLRVDELKGAAITTKDIEILQGDFQRGD